MAELGRNIKRARLARRMAILDIAERAGVSQKTIQRLEAGDPGVGIGKLAATLAALGEADALGGILRLEDDAIGLSRAVEALPKRGTSHIRRGRRDPTAQDKDDGDEGVGF